jgi:deazaflavin-dependent oxidoreductase (nitroreductase family)
MAIVIHTGRKSHRQHRTPVLVFRREHHFIIALTYGRESQWVQNVLAQNGCDLEIVGRTVRVTRPRIVRDPQRHSVPSLVRIALRLINVSDFLEMTLAD